MSGVILGALALALEAPVSLLEASGVTNGTGWDFDAISPPSSTLCGGAPSSVLVSHTGTLTVLQGPTPHAALTVSVSQLRASSPWLAAAAASPSWLIVVRGDAAAVLAIEFASGCSGVKQAVSSSPATHPPIAGWAALAPGGPSPPGAVGLAGDALLRLTVSASGVVSAGTALPLPPLGGGCSWRCVAGTGGAGGAAGLAGERFLVAAACGGQRANNTFLLDGSGQVLASLAATDGTQAGEGADDWVGAVFGDVVGSGEAGALLVSRNAVALPFSLGGGESGGVPLGGPFRPWKLEPPGRAWAAAVGGHWLDGGSGGATAGGVQLLALRRYDAARSGGAFVVNLLVYGAPHVFLARRRLLEGTLGQSELTHNLNMTYYPFNTSLMMHYLSTTHSNTHVFELCGPNSYLRLVELLHATQGFTVGGAPLRVWAELLPPTEAIADKCVIAEDSPLTPFNETASFNASAGYLDYAGYADVLGQLGRAFPRLVALQVDDFTHDLPPGGIFGPALLSRMTSRMRSHAPHMSFLPVVYYSEGGGGPVGKAFPDLFLTMDLPTYFFRNQKQGAGPCAAPRCDRFWGPSTRPPLNESKAGGCLAGPCAEATLANVADELDDLASWLEAPGRKAIIFGVYATGHSSLGTPTAAYVRALPQVGLSHPDVIGALSWTMLAPCGPRAAPGSCEGNGGYDTWLIDLCAKGCALQDAYAELGAAHAAKAAKRERLHLAPPTGAIK